jgi:putative nucleotidyltransferase with HDIG domain
METKLPLSMHAYVASSEDHKGGILLTAKTTFGNLPLKFWRMENKEQFPKTGDYIHLESMDPEAAQKELQQYKSISLDSKYDKPLNYLHKIVDESEVPPETRKIINRDRTPQLATAMTILNDPSPWKDQKTHLFLKEFMEENQKRFFNAPAATSKHHNWRGGLLVHTAEVAANCMAILNSPMNQFYLERVDTDSLLLGAWFHDTGKMDTYRMEGDKPVSDKDMENKIGHIVLGNQIFRDYARDSHLEQKSKDLVSHCILSHHERREWGSAVEPDSIEAHILCRADYISSRMPD